MVGVCGLKCQSQGVETVSYSVGITNILLSVDPANHAVCPFMESVFTFGSYGGFSLRLSSKCYNFFSVVLVFWRRRVGKLYDFFPFKWQDQVNTKVKRNSLVF